MYELNIDDLRMLYNKRAVLWSAHALKQLQERRIHREDIETCIMNGEIIEQYPNDYPFPSCLILGIDTGNKTIHAVIGSDGEHIWIITAYYPSPLKWEADFKTRKRDI